MEANQTISENQEEHILTYKSAVLTNNRLQVITNKKSSYILLQNIAMIETGKSDNVVLLFVGIVLVILGFVFMHMADQFLWIGLILGGALIAYYFMSLENVIKIYSKGSGVITFIIPGNVNEAKTFVKKVEDLILVR